MNDPRRSAPAGGRQNSAYDVRPCGTPLGAASAGTRMTFNSKDARRDPSLRADKLTKLVRVPEAATPPTTVGIPSAVAQPEERLATASDKENMIMRNRSVLQGPRMLPRTSERPGWFSLARCCPETVTTFSWWIKAKRSSSASAAVRWWLACPWRTSVASLYKRVPGRPNDRWRTDLSGYRQSPTDKGAGSRMNGRRMPVQLAAVALFPVASACSNPDRG